ncbi:Protein of unknown function [Leuconostoc citreum]|nr:Protein of unknown function [Leuconostoc citreum]
MGADVATVVYWIE